MKALRDNSCSAAGGPAFSIGLQRASLNLSCRRNNWGWFMLESVGALFEIDASRINSIALGA